MTEFIEKNIVALMNHQPNLARLLLDSEPDPAYGVTQVPDSSIVIYMRQGDQNIVLSHPQKAELLAKEFIEKKNELVKSGEPLFFAGMRAGYEIREAYVKSKRSDWKAAQAIYIFEPSIDIFRLNLLTADWTGMIQSGRIFFFCGPSASKQCSEFFINDKAKPQPSQVLILSNAETAQSAAKLLGSIKSETIKRTAAIKDRVDAFYEDFSDSRLASRYLDPTKLRLLLISNRLSYFIRYSIRDVKAALESLGIQVEVAEERSDVDRLSLPLLLSTLDRFKPHGLLFIDHLRSENKNAYPANLPFLTYLQDFMQNIFNPKAAQEITRRDIVFGITQGLIGKSYDTERLFHLPILTNPDVYKIDSPTPKENYAHTFSFVSNISASHEAASKKLIEKYNALGEPGVAKVVQAVYEMAKKMDSRDEMFDDFQKFKFLIKDTSEAGNLQLTPVQINNLANEVYDDLIAPWLRCQTMEWIVEAGYDLALYGRGWEAHPRLSACAKGVAENGPGLAEIFRKTKFNLHINQYGIDHHRLMDGLCAGGFFLVRKASSMGLLSLDECMFDSKESFFELVNRFDEHPEKRKRIVDENRRIIRQQATHAVGLKQLLTYFGATNLGALISDSIKQLESFGKDESANVIEKLNLLGKKLAEEPAQFGFQTVLSLLNAFGSLSDDAIKRLEALDEYQGNWGSPAWPPQFDSQQCKSVIRIIEKIEERSERKLPPVTKALLEAWSQKDDVHSLAYRRFRNRVDGIEESPEETMDDISDIINLIPVYRAAYSAKSSKFFASMKALKTSRFLPEDVQTGIGAALLAYQKSFNSAYQRMKERYVAPGADEYVKIATAPFGELAGHTKEAKALLETVKLRRPTAMVMKARVLLSEGNLKDAEKTLENIDIPELVREQAQMIQTFCLVEKGRLKAARKALGDPDRFESRTLQSAAMHIRRYLGSGGRRSNRDKSLMRYVKTYKIGKDIEENVYRIDKIRALSDSTLICRTCTQGREIMLFDTEKGQMAKVPENLLQIAKAGQRPAFDVHDSKLYLVEVNKAKLFIFDESFNLEVQRALPKSFLGYAEDIAVAADQTVALLDSYRSRMLLLSPEGDNKWLPLEFENTNTPIRIAAVGDKFAIFNFDTLTLIDRMGRPAEKVNAGPYHAEIFADDHNLFVASGRGGGLVVLDKQLKEQEVLDAMGKGRINLSASAFCTYKDLAWMVDDCRGELTQMKIERQE